MLSNIKGRIAEQKALLEQAGIIAEDVMGNLDDMIVLGEGVSDDLEVEGGELPDGGMDNPSMEEPETSGEPTEEPTEEESEGEEDLLDSPIDVGSDLPAMDMSGEDLPTPIGAQTGEPAHLDSSDLLNMEIDLSTNTPTDILPIPPAGAADAVVDGEDLPTQKLDSGFGGEEPNPDPVPPAEPTPGPEEPAAPSETPEGSEGSEVPGEEQPSTEEPATPEPTPESTEDPEQQGDPVTEAITIDGGDGGGEEPPAAEEPAPDEGMEGEGENAVTSAVRDKVSEAEGNVEEEIPEEPVEDFGGAGENENKDKILQRLINLTKDLEAAKEDILKKI